MNNSSPSADFSILRSPFFGHIGLEVLEWCDGLARIGVDLRSFHLNRHGITHGGVILSLIDESGAAAGNWCSVPGNIRRSVTVDLNAHFTGRASSGRVIASARVMSQGRKIFFAFSEIHDAGGMLIAFGSSTHRRNSGSEPLTGTPLTLMPAAA